MDYDGQEDAEGFPGHPQEHQEAQQSLPRVSSFLSYAVSPQKQAQQQQIQKQKGQTRTASSSGQMDEDVGPDSAAGAADTSTSTSTSNNKKKAKKGKAAKNSAAQEQVEQSIADEEQGGDEVEIGGEQVATGTSVFPIARMQRIIKADEDLTNCSAEAAFLIAIATECFIKYFVEEAYEFARMEKRRTISYKDCQRAVSRNWPLGFLQEAVPPTIPLSVALQKASALEASALRGVAVSASGPPTSKNGDHLDEDEGEDDEEGEEHGDAPVIPSGGGVIQNKKKRSTSGTSQKKGTSATNGAGRKPRGSTGKGKGKRSSGAVRREDEEGEDEFADMDQDEGLEAGGGNRYGTHDAELGRSNDKKPGRSGGGVRQVSEQQNEDDIDDDEDLPELGSGGGRQHYEQQNDDEDEDEDDERGWTQGERDRMAELQDIGEEALASHYAAQGIGRSPPLHPVGEGPHVAAYMRDYYE